MMIPNSFVAFDLETTGMKPPCKIIEIGAVKICDDEIVDTYQQLIEPEIMIPWQIVNLTGIDDGMVTGQPVIADVLPRFIDFIGDYPIVAHNASFDMGFMRYYADEYGYEITNEVLDSLSLSRKLLKGLPN